MPLNVGDRLGHYDVTALIGERGMGQVYQATDTQLNRQVALKVDRRSTKLMFWLIIPSYWTDSQWYRFPRVQTDDLDAPGLAITDTDSRPQSSATLSGRISATRQRVVR